MNKVKTPIAGHYEIRNSKGEFIATARFSRRRVYDFTEAFYIDRRTGEKVETDHAFAKDFKEFLVNKDFG